MTDDIVPDITALLSRWRGGDREAESALLDAVYPALRDIARKQLHGQRDFTLSATELAHETYARLCRNTGIDFHDRGHFYAIAARAARHFVIDYVRSRDSEKRGSGLPFVALDELAEEVADDRIDLRVDWLAVHEALVELERKDRDSARIVELKFFSGLTTEEIAEAVGMSRATVVRDWRFAKAWLAGRLRHRD
ncbi:ECF-type sigma factor [Tahibacter caeni]|uniref:ECF-type sigma factor n=1 Tax=Tahibacter caeni TaxID=1453545 RepID=UPI00214946DD|nr:ECF-type sigma factor [Tahibacter caeni]